MPAPPTVQGAGSGSVDRIDIRTDTTAHPGDPEAAADIIGRLRAAGCVFAEDEAELLAAEATGPDHLANMVDQRIAGRPLEQILGWAGFAGRRIAVRPGVFVPRRRTEFLAELAGHWVAPGTVCVELCCGTGAVSAALIAECPAAEVHAVDSDRRAVVCARLNLPGGHVYKGDLYDPLPDRLLARVDVIVANAPYVPRAELAFMPPEARDHEPATALDGGLDGLDLHRRIAARAREWLRPNGHLLVETSRRQAAQTAAAFVAGGLDAAVEYCDEREATVVVGRIRR